MDDERYLLRAIDLAARARSKGNEPFGALIVDPDGNVSVGPPVERGPVGAYDFPGARALLHHVAHSAGPAANLNPLENVSIASHVPVTNDVGEGW